MTTGPPSHGVQSARWTRERLLRLGLTEEHVVLAEAPKQPRFGPADLDPTQFTPEFSSLVQRLQRLLRAGRGLSVHVTGARADATVRQHAALQIALGLGKLGRQVVLVDADFLRPGLGGMVADPEAEGVIDMVRFGRSCRSLLMRPVPEGPWILPAGSFPTDEPMPLGPEALRSLVYRVCQVCDLALYVGPLPLRNDLNPLSRVCDHVIYAALDEEPESGQAIVDATGELQKQNAHVAGVVLYTTEFEAALAPEMPAVPGAPAAPPVAVGVEPPAFGPELLNPPPEPADFGPLPPRVGAAPLARELPPAASAAAAAGELLAPPAAAGVTERPREAAVPGPPRLEPTREPSAGAREPEPAGAAPETHRFATRSDETEATDERARRELAGAVTARAVARSSDEAEQVREEMDLPDSEFAFDEEGRYSRAPLYLLLALIVFIAVFGTWAYVTWRSSHRTERAQTELPPRAEIGEPAPAGAGSGAPGKEEAPRTEMGTKSGGPATAPDDGGAHQAQPPAGPEPQELPAAGTGTQPEPAAGGSAPSATPSGAASAPQGAATEPSPAAGGATTPSGPGAPPPSAPGATTVTSPAPGAAQRPPAVTPTPPAGESVTKSTGAGALPSANAPGGDYTVHVASYKKIEQAYQDIANLQKHGYEARAVKTDLGSKGLWYRVYVGSYSTAADAAKARDAIRQLPGYDYGMVTRLPRE